MWQYPDDDFQAHVQAVNGQKYFLLVDIQEELRSTRGRAFDLLNGCLLYDMKNQGENLKNFHYYGVARVSPCTVTPEEVAKSNHLGVLKALMTKILGVSQLESEVFLYKVKCSESVKGMQGWKDLKIASWEKRRIYENKRVLIWNNGAGFSDSIDSLLDACKFFDYLAYFDWDLSLTEIRQRLHFVSCNSLMKVLQQLTAIFDNIKNLGGFHSREAFKQAFKLKQLMPYRDYGNAYSFLEQIVIQNANIRRRNCSRGKQVWKLMVEEVPADSDDECIE
ncbi:hypothetical protein MIR68_008893 [Amoeboaphelidium protococcarum]|nr:hypothetical protein MIR68_008893 [Amoeboaphelidium protococcarum]